MYINERGGLVMNGLDIKRSLSGDEVLTWGVKMYFFLFFFNVNVISIRIASFYPVQLIRCVARETRD